MQKKNLIFKHLQIVIFTINHIEMMNLMWLKRKGKLENFCDFIYKKAGFTRALAALGGNNIYWVYLTIGVKVWLNYGLSVQRGFLTVYAITGKLCSFLSAINFYF